jgi:hypothetical protein
MAIMRDERNVASYLMARFALNESRRRRRRSLLPMYGTNDAERSTLGDVTINYEVPGC